LKEAALKEAALKEAALKEAALKEKEAALLKEKEANATRPGPLVERVKRVTHEGKQYLRSTTSGIVYTADKEQVGTWDEANQTIIFDPLSEESSEEEEEEYDI
jgi:hypothetical protein